MLRLEEFMEIQKLHHDGVSITEIGRRLALDRKTARKYLHEAPRPYRRKARSSKVDPHRGYLRERWEQGVHNAQRLFGEIQKRGYIGCYTQVKRVVRGWRREEQERAFVRFETAPGVTASLLTDNMKTVVVERVGGGRSGISRMRYVEFTQRQDAERLLNCLGGTA
jgi:transposase